MYPAKTIAMHFFSTMFNVAARHFLVLALLIAFGTNIVHAQIRSVNSIQNLSFGAFSQGSAGGTLSISHDGLRTSTGTVVPLNLGYAYYQAIFTVDASPGTIISILNGPDAVLTGSNGGSMSLRLGTTEPSSPFTAAENPTVTQVSMGGTLTVGNAQETPAGVYTGSFFITFNNE
jgi:hypothetical protein